MLKNRVSSLSILLSSLLFLSIGLTVALWPGGALVIFRYFLASVLLASGVLQIVQGIMHIHESKMVPVILSAALNLCLAAVVFVAQGIFVHVIPFSFGVWAMFMGLIRSIIYLEYRRDKIGGRIFTLLGSVVAYLFGIVLILSPDYYFEIVTKAIGGYLIFYAFTIFGDFLREVFPRGTTDKIKRRIRINLPVWWATFLPKRTVETINKLLKAKNAKEISLDSKKRDVVTDLEIFVHSGTKGPAQFGHVDLYYNGLVLSYGNYDKKSKRLLDSVGDGIFFTTPHKDKYLEFCIDYSQKTIFGFGLSLSDVQKAAVEKAIEEIKADLIPWVPDAIANGEVVEESDYPSRLFEETQAEFYKFSRGSFKTYFLFGTNCVLLADKIVGSSGTDILSLNGIVSPGTYYDYLNREFMRDLGIVISRTIYTKSTFQDRSSII